MVKKGEQMKKLILLIGLLVLIKPAFLFGIELGDKATVSDI